MSGGPRPVGATSVARRGVNPWSGVCCVARSMTSRWPGLAPAGDFLSCVAKKGSKEGDPASPVIRCANDSPALLEVGGRRGTRRLRRLRQPRRTSPPTSPLLGGSDGLSGITEPGLGLWSGLNGGRKADALGAFDRNGRPPGANSPANPCLSNARNELTGVTRRAHVGRLKSPLQGRPMCESVRGGRGPFLTWGKRGGATP